MQIHEVIIILREQLKDISFDDIPSKLPTLDLQGLTFRSCRKIDDDLYDLDIDYIVKGGLSYLYTITLRRIVVWTPVPISYITINNDTLMADNIEVFVGNADMVSTDIKIDKEGTYYTETPIALGDIDYIQLTEHFAKDYSLLELLEAITDTIKDGETLLRVLHNVKEFYAFGYDQEN